MRKIVLLAMLVLVFAGTADALYEEQIFKNWVESGKYFSISGQNYSATYIRNANITVVRFPDGFSTVIEGNESCHEDWIYKVCLLGKKFTLNDKTVPWDTHSERVESSIQLQIYASYANVELKKQYTKTDFVVGESEVVSLVINNTGGLDTTAKLTEVYPINFRLDHVSGCDVSGQKVSMTKFLVEQQKATCSYKVTALKEGEKLQSDLVLNYTVLDRSKQKTSTYKYNIEGTAVMLQLYNESISTGPSDEEFFQVNITALEDVDISMFRMTFPQQIIVLESTEEFRPNTRTIEWRGALDKDEKISINMTLKTDLIINTSFSYELYYGYNDINKQAKDQVDFRSSQEFFYIGLVNTTEGTMLRVANPSKNIFKDITISLMHGGVKVGTIEIPEIGPKRFSEHALTESIDTYVADFKTVFGQPMSMQSTISFIERTDIFADLTKTETEKPKEEPRKSAPPEELEFEPKAVEGLDMKTFAIIGGAFLLIVTILFSVLFRSKHHDLDKEIKEIRSKMKEEDKEETKDTAQMIKPEDQN